MFGYHALMHDLIERPTGRGLVLKQRQKKLHVKHLKRLIYFKFRGITNPFKQCRVYMVDENEGKRVNHTSILREMMSMQVHCAMESEAEEEEDEVQELGEEAKESREDVQEGEGTEQGEKETVSNPTESSPVMDGVYYDPNRLSLAVSIIAKRKEARAVCERMREYFSAWMDGFLVQQRYHERTIESLLDCLGEDA